MRKAKTTLKNKKTNFTKIDKSNISYFHSKIKGNAAGIIMGKIKGALQAMLGDGQSYSTNQVIDAINSINIERIMSIKGNVYSIFEGFDNAWIDSDKILRGRITATTQPRGLFKKRYFVRNGNTIVGFDVTDLICVLKNRNLNFALDEVIFECGLNTISSDVRSYQAYSNEDCLKIAKSNSEIIEELEDNDFPYLYKYVDKFKDIYVLFNELYANQYSLTRGDKVPMGYFLLSDSYIAKHLDRYSRVALNKIINLLDALGLVCKCRDLDNVPPSVKKRALDLQKKNRTSSPVNVYMITKIDLDVTERKAKEMYLRGVRYSNITGERVQFVKSRWNLGNMNKSEPIEELEVFSNDLIELIKKSIASNGFFSKKIIEGQVLGLSKYKDLPASEISKRFSIVFDSVVIQIHAERVKLSRLDEKQREILSSNKEFVYMLKEEEIANELSKGDDKAIEKFLEKRPYITRVVHDVSISGLRKFREIYDANFKLSTKEILDWKYSVVENLPKKFNQLLDKLDELGSLIKLAEKKGDEELKEEIMRESLKVEGIIKSKENPKQKEYDELEGWEDAF